MATKKIRIQNMVDNSIGSDQLINDGVKLPVIKQLGGSDNISGATGFELGCSVTGKHIYVMGVVNYHALKGCGF